MSPWIYLSIAIFFELAGTIFLKFSANANNKWGIALTLIFYGISFTFMWFAVKKIDISIAYAIWGGVGIALISIFGIFFFKEEISLMKAIFLLFIIIGVGGLKYLSE